jgi:hypothetical protein
MLTAILEKLAYGIAAVVLFCTGRLARSLLAGGVIDLILAALFVIAFSPNAARLAPCLRHMAVGFTIEAERALGRRTATHQLRTCCNQAPGR